MKTSDKFISAVTLGLLAPVLLALLLWWCGYLINNDLDKGFLFLIVAGAAAGIALNATVLRKFIFSLYKLPLAALFAVEIFYSVMIFGVFMGMPAFNVLAGIAGSFIIIKKGIVNSKSKDEIKADARKINIFSSVLLLIICVCSAALALNERSIGSQLKSMLGLPFNVEMWMIWLLIIIGGALLLAFQYVVSALILRAALRSGNKAQAQ